MDETREIKSLGDGRYTFWVGKQKYTLSTRLEASAFFRTVENARELVELFPPNLSQDERLFLALMAVCHQNEDLRARIEAIAEKFCGKDG